MHHADPTRWQHSHHFSAHSSTAERRTRIVIGITATMMVIEIVGGILFHSMAVLADGWHMGTHVSAFLITAIAYHFARRHANDPHFSFGTGKMGVLGGFASAIVLSVVAFLMAGESVYRFLVPLPIHFSEAIGIASVALLPGEIRRAVESDGDSLVTDLHIWQVSTEKFAAIVSVVAHHPKSSDTYREMFREHEELVHVTVDVQQCHEHDELHATT